MKFSSMLLVGAALFVSAGAHAQSSRVKVTYSGTVGYGYDQTGEFGTAGADLTGKSFVASYVFDPSLGYQYHGSSSGYTYDYNYGGTNYGAANPLVGASITIGGKTLDLSLPNFGEIYNYSVNGYNYQFNQGVQSSFANNVSTSTNLYNYTYGYDAQMLPGGYGAYDGPVASYYTAGYFGDSAFDYNTYTQTRNTYASLNADHLTIGAVPEPATWAMMLLGFGMVGAGLRHRRKSTRVSVA